MVPVLMLYHEHDPDPEMRPEPIGAEQRETVIEYMAAGLVGAYRYFREHGRSDLGTRATEPRNTKTQDWSERPVSVRLREEVQALLRRRHHPLNRSRRLWRES
jgi:hypothetical protein